MTYAEFGTKVELFRKVLHELGLGKDDKVAVISNNRIEWAVACFATASIGGQIVPMYEAQLEKDWEYILEDSGAKIILASTTKVFSKVKGYIGTVGKVASVLCFDEKEETLHSYSRWLKLAETLPAVPDHTIDPSHLAAIIYTSGTTGKPKGVELSHDNLLGNVRGILAIAASEQQVSIMEDKVALVFLPWAHIYGQTCELYVLMCIGSTMALTGRDEILENLAIVKPSLINSVPMLYNKVYDAVHAGVSESSPLRQKIFHYAYDVARRRNQALEFGQSVGFFLNLQHSFFDKLVFSKIRARLGGNLMGMTSGGAKLGDKVIRFFTDTGILVLEGYGLTETSPVITFNGPEWRDRRLGTVGVCIPGMEVLIIDPSTGEKVPNGEDGEICVHGVSVMVGYHKNPKANEEVFLQIDGKRFFRTGDQGKFVDNRFLKITGRIKEQYKLENGKYVVPIVVEDAVNRSKFVMQSFVFGDNKKFNTMIVIPEMAELQKWLKRTQPTASADPVEVMENPAVKELISDEIATACVGLKGYERPHIWTYVLEPFTQENQMMTPKLSTRRTNVIKVYGHLLDDMYAGKLGTTLARQPTKNDD